MASSSSVNDGQLNHPLIRGWLQKRSRHMKQWRKRWVVLEESCIYTFKTDTNQISQATEIIDLHTALYIKPLNDIEPNTTKIPSDLSHCFEIYCTNVTFIFNAETKESMNLWMKYIEQQLFKTSLDTNSSLDTINTMATNKINEKLWVCNVCAYQNALDFNACKLCGNDKPQQAAKLKLVKVMYLYP